MFIYTPVESSNLFLQYADELQHDPGVHFGTQQLDKVIIPARRGEVIGIIGNSGFGKSAYMSFLAVNEARAIKMRGTGTTNKNTPGEAVLYATWEQTVETQEAATQANGSLTTSDIHWGRTTQRQLVKSQQARLNLPLWIAGHSHYGQSVKAMYVDDLFSEIIKTQTQFNIKFRAIVLDYLQLIPVHKGRNRIEQISQAILDTKDLARNAGCPVFVGVQAKREVLERQNPIAGQGDTYYSSELDHVLSKGLSVFKVSKMFATGSTFNITHRGLPQRIQVTDNLFVINLFKQRGDSGSKRFMLHFDVNTMTLGDVDLDS